MVIKYIGTPDIKVFPSAFRNGDEEAKRTTEENLVKFNRLSSSTNNLDQMFFDPDDSDYVIFNIHGYWFRCLETSIPIGNNLFAYIKLEKVEGIGWRLSAIPESALDDEDSNFTGLGFDIDIPEDIYDNGELTVKYYGLKVRDGNGKIVEQKLKLTSDEIRNKNTDRSIREELTTGSINAEEINAEEINTNEISVTANITVTGNVQSSSITTGNITANGKEINISNSEIKLGNISIKSSTSEGTVNPAEFLVNNSATTKTQIHMPKPVSGTSAILHLPTDVASGTTDSEYIWAQKLDTNRTNRWYKLGDGSAAGDIIQAQPGGSIAAKINGVAINSTGSDVSIKAPSNDSIIFPASKSGNVAFMSDIQEIEKNKVLRTRSPNTSLTGFGGGGNSIEVLSPLSPGDTIMIEVSDSISNIYTPKIVSVTLGSASTEPNSDIPGYITSWTTWNGTTMTIYSFTVTHSGSTLYFGSKKKISGTFSGTNISWSTSNYALYVGKVWKV